MIKITTNLTFCLATILALAFGAAEASGTVEVPASNASPAVASAAARISIDTDTGEVCLINGRLELRVETRTGLNPRRLRDLQTGQVFADADYVWPGGQFPKLIHPPDLESQEGGGQSVQFIGLLGALEVRQTFTAPEAMPGVLIERIAIRNPGGEPLATATFKCGFAKRLQVAGQWLPDALQIHCSKVPYRRGTGSEMSDYILREIAERKDSYTGWNEPVVQSSTWGSEGWVWSDGKKSFLIAKYNPEAMEWSLMESVVLSAGKEPDSKEITDRQLRFGGAGQWKQGVPEGATQLSPGATFGFGETWLQVVDGDWKEAFYAYRRFTESRGCCLRPEYNPPVHWNELYDVPYYSTVAAMGDNDQWQNRELMMKFYNLQAIEAEAAKAKELGGQALYLDPSWDTGACHAIWDTERLGAPESFLERMRQHYGLQVSLWTALASPLPSYADPEVYPIEARRVDRDGHRTKILCSASPAFLNTKAQRLIALGEKGFAFMMFDGSQYVGPCYDTTHGHSIPLTRHEHVMAYFDLIQRVKQRCPKVLIELHDPVSGPSGIHYTPTYFLYAKTNSFDELWGHEFMWDSMGDLLSRRALSLYYYNLAYSLPLYLHIGLKSDNENALAFWYYASTCRHLGVGGKHPDPKVWTAHKLAMQTYLRLKPFYTQGVFYGLDETVHAHTLPAKQECVLNIFNLENTEIKRHIRFHLAEVGLSKGSVSIEGAEAEVKGDEITLEVRVPARGQRLVQIRGVGRERASTPPPVPTRTPRMLSLDGKWLLATDPKNVGREQKWSSAPVPGAKESKVPWIIQDAFPNYHGVAWYWRDFVAPANPFPQGRYLLRFWSVDYLAEVWVNDRYVGGHEGADGPFVLDVTEAIHTKAPNRVAVRVLNPSDDPIDGITLKQTPHRNKTCAFVCGCDYNHGGIEDSVELFMAPAARVENLFVRPESKSGTIYIEANLRHTRTQSVVGHLEFNLAPASSGELLNRITASQELPPGDTLVKTQLTVANPHLWELNDPYLYRLTARLSIDGEDSWDEQSTRCGFRSFRFADGYFRLNGRRLFLKSSVTGNMAPIGTHVPYDSDWFRRDLLNVKTMGFNALRFYGLATRTQLDLCDEIGLLVYEEPYSSQLFEDSPKMAERFDRSTAEMIRRDRNHPSVVIWGLLNETADSPQFRHAVETLALVRSLDDSRMVLLSSGRFDCQLGIGSLANPGANTWEYLLGGEEAGAPPTKATPVPAYIEGVGDAHVYPWVPHTAKEIQFLRTLGQKTKPVFLSEYGIASALDLVRVVRHYEQRHQQASGEGAFYRRSLDLFMADWERWRMAECFAAPEDYFGQCLASMAPQRLMGINALRANPHLAGYSLTGTVDQGYTGEGLTTTFRELKPGTIDAVFDGFAPLRWCLFVEPVNVYRGTSLQLEAVLANEDALAPGEYPARFDIVGPNRQLVWSRQTNVLIDRSGRQVHSPEPPFALPILSESVAADWPAGHYRFVAAFKQGAAATGGDVEFFLVDRASMPAVKTEVTVWGEDAELGQWLAGHGIQIRQFSAALPATAAEVILVGEKAPAPGGAEVFRELAARIAQGSTAIFLSPNVFAYAGKPTRLSSLGKKGELINLPNNVYHKDDWAKRHPVFDGLPAGGLMDYTYYRELITNLGWSCPEAPAEAVAGAIYAFTGYSSGLLVSVDTLGSGRFILNTLRIRENLGKHPAADRLLINLLRYAAR